MNDLVHSQEPYCAPLDPGVTKRAFFTNCTGSQIGECIVYGIPEMHSIFVE